MPPSEYFKRNCWISVEADEETVPHFIDTFGDDQLIFSTDYPHGDSKFPHAVDAFDKLPMTRRGQGRDREHQLVGPLQDPARQAHLTPRPTQRRPAALNEQNGISGDRRCEVGCRRSHLPHSAARPAMR